MTRTLISAIALALLAGRASAADLGAVTDQLVEAQGKLKSYSASFTSKTDVTKTMSRRSQGTFEWVRTDKGVKFRKDVKSLTTHVFDGEKQVVDENRSFIADGTFYYSVNNDTKTVIKQDYEPASIQSADVSAVLSQLSNNYNTIKVVGEEKAAGQDCWVIECSGNPMNDDADPDDPFMAVDKEKHWFAKDTGMEAKVESYDKAGKVVRSLTVADVKKDPEIGPDRFAAPRGK